MLKRLYIHNYKCLVNFEIRFDNDISLFLGGNGSGKTSVLNALYGIQRLIIHNEMLDAKNNIVFPSTSLSRRLSETIQKFEIDVDANNGTYKYSLEIEHYFHERNLRRVKSEVLTFDGQSLFHSKIEEDADGALNSVGGLFNEKTGSDSKYTSNWFGSILGTVQETQTNKKLAWFKKYLERFYFLRINPNTITVDMEIDEAHLDLDAANFAAWLNYWNNENSEGVLSTTNAVKDVIEDFSSFKFSKSGDKKQLMLNVGNRQYRFDELSDGQKALIVLYTLVYCVPEESIIYIDEPENFLALPEIQPWFDVLYAQCEEKNLQAFLISHHPKIINFLANDSGYWMSLENNFARLQRIADDNQGLSIIELIERGWLYEQ